jgi:DNA-directed RNA polymerase subunit beta'
VPIAHIWYFRSLPNKIGYILGLPSKKLDMIIYYERYVVIQPGIAKGPDGEAISSIGFLDRRRIFKYFRFTSSRKSIS